MIRKLSFLGGLSERPTKTRKFCRKIMQQMPRDEVSLETIQDLDQQMTARAEVKVHDNCPPTQNDVNIFRITLARYTSDTFYDRGSAYQSLMRALYWGGSSNKLRFDQCVRLRIAFSAFTLAVARMAHGDSISKPVPASNYFQVPHHSP